MADHRLLTLVEYEQLHLQINGLEAEVQRLQRSLLDQQSRMETWKELAMKRRQRLEAALEENAELNTQPQTIQATLRKWGQGGDADVEAQS